VSSAAWGAIGTVIGGLLTVSTTWLLSRSQRRDAQAAEAARSAQRSTQERKQAYMQLLVTCRQLRFAARPGSSQTTETIELLRTDLSSLTYEIDLIAPKAVALQSQDLAQATRDYLRKGQVLAARSAAEWMDQERADLDQARSKVRELVDRFIDLARADIDR
jgi:hypothetical protein